MEKSECKDYALELIRPEFDSPSADLIIDLDYLRKKPLKGSTHIWSSPFLNRTTC
jgi:hypothetical protein